MYIKGSAASLSVMECSDGNMTDKHMQKWWGTQTDMSTGDIILIT